MKRIFSVLAFLISYITAFAYTQVPADSAVVKGVLPNGLTYYIRHNDFIPNRAAFHIAQKVGSIQEMPEQRGLAHFLEHMAFNATTHFPGKSLSNYLETIGVKNGANLNAYTSVDETVYMITDVPTERISTIDSCLLILRDWSDGILLEDKAIDAERGVIEEEWRTRNSPMQRQIEKLSPVMYAGDKYADCMPIGNIDVIRNFSYETLRSYYKTWYRPDLQGIVVVGDIDVQRTEEKIKELFADVKVPADAPERIYYPVSEYKEPCVMVSADPEMSFSLACYYQKIDKLPDSLNATEEDLRTEIIAYFTSSMLGERLNDLAKSKQPPFAGAWVDYSSFMLSERQKCFAVETKVSAAGAEVAFTAMMDEVERMRRFGFTQLELERAKKSYLALAEQVYNHRDQQENSFYVDFYVNNFLNGEFMPSMDTYIELARRLSAEITLEDINAWIASWNSNNALAWCTGPDLKELPTEDAIKNEMSALPNKELVAYEDIDIPETIIPEDKAPHSGKILKKKSVKNGAIEYKLSNGVEVYFKQTDFKDDEILLSAKSLGGLTKADSTDWMNARCADELYAASGTGTMNKIQLDKFLSDKRASLYASINMYTEELSGSASKKDIEYLFQLLYANFTTVNVDSTAFSSYKERFIANCKDRKNSPYSTLQDTVVDLVYGNNKLTKYLEIDDLKELDYTRSLEIFRERFSNAADFKFTIVGNIDEKKLESLLEKYVASLPTSKAYEKVGRGEPMDLVGEDSARFNKQMQVPATIAYMHNFVKIKPSANKLSYDILQDILDIVYTEKVREEEGGTYGVGVYVEVNKYPCENVELTIQFSTDSAKVDKLMPIIYAELKNIAENGPREADLQKVKEHKKKEFADLQKDNYYWRARLQSIQMNGKDNGATYLKRLEKISAKDIQKAAQKLIVSKNLKEVVQVGVGMTEK